MVAPKTRPGAHGRIVRLLPRQRRWRLRDAGRRDVIEPAKDGRDRKTGKRGIPEKSQQRAGKIHRLQRQVCDLEQGPRANDIQPECSKYAPAPGLRDELVDRVHAVLPSPGEIIPADCSVRATRRHVVARPRGIKPPLQDGAPHKARCKKYQQEQAGDLTSAS